MSERIETDATGKTILSGWLQRALELSPLFIVLAVWEFSAQAGFIRALFLPPLTEVLEQSWVLLWEGEVIGPLLTSLYRAFAGLFIAIGLGVVVGVSMARLKWVRWALDPLVSLAFPTPKIAFVPVFVLWFGIDHLSKILLVTFTCVFPIIIAAFYGASSLSRTLIWSAQAMGTPVRQMLTHVVLPGALPYIVTGIRVTVPMALITSFTAEMVAGGGGVGALLMYAQRFFQTPVVFVYILVMAATGLLFDWAMLKLRRRLLPWESENVSF